MTPPGAPSSDDPKPAQYWTWAAYRQGGLDVLPFLPGLAAFAMAYGTLAARKGLTLFETLLMSATVFSGVVQMVVLDSWPQTLTAGAIVGIVALTALINGRYVMIGATLRPLLSPAAAYKAYPTLFFLVEPAWLTSLRYYDRGGRDPAYLLGGGMMMYAIWSIMAVPGYLAGAAVSDPRRFGIDLMMPAFFVAMLVSLWRGPRKSFGIVVGAGAAVLTEVLVGGHWYLIVGALAGSLAGVFNDD